MLFLSFLITFFACALGSVCGMGGGIIIKPTLDATGFFSVAAITFLSGCTVIAMSGWSVGKTLMAGESVIDVKKTTPLAISAAVGGLAGKQLLQTVTGLFADPDTVGGLQAVFLLAATAATFLYTLKKDKFQTKNVDNLCVILLIGFFLGVLGSFLGVGGGPFNVAMLCYFFSMPTKIATQNSLYIVLFSQLASTGKTLLSSGFPNVSVWLLAGMIVCGIIGSSAGRLINKKIDDRQATWLFEGAMVLVMCINLFNIVQYF